MDAARQVRGIFDIPPVNTKARQHRENKQKQGGSERAS